MDKRLIISGDDRIGLLEGGSFLPEKQTQIVGAGAVYTNEERIYCVSNRDHVIWQMDAATLMPTALFAGGPGMCDLLMADDGRRLYVLCGEGDSVLMLDVCAGVPLMLCRAGAAPARMALDQGAGVLAVAGGRAEAVLLYCAETLEHLETLPMPGLAVDVALRDGWVYALCQGEEKNAILVSIRPCGKREVCCLSGLPGALLLRNGAVFVGVEDAIHIRSGNTWQEKNVLHVAGRPSNMMIWREGVVYTEQYTHTLMMAGGRSGNAMLCAQVENIALI